MKALLCCDVADGYFDYLQELKQQLSGSGYSQFAESGISDNLPEQIAEQEADLVILMLASPNQRLLDNLRSLDREAPVPVILLAQQSDHATTTAAIMSGVSAYIVGDLPRNRMKTVLGVALARFQVRHQFKSDLASYKQRLDDRRDLDKAKGKLMEQRQVSEDEAYQLLRKMAMDQNIRIGEAARSTLRVLNMLG